MEGAPPVADDLTVLIRRVRDGDDAARSDLFSTAYADLRQLASSRLRGGGRPQDFNTTALVHESYLRFLRGGELRAADRRAFFAYASQVMRSVIVDQVREQEALRRGGDVRHDTLDSELGLADGQGESEILQVHEALAALAKSEPRLAQVVEMRYFGGYTEIEISSALDLTPRTVRRDWEKARLLLIALMKT
jgi:RNA polymerase sigma factor (TIGR02999 family)